MNMYSVVRADAAHLPCENASCDIVLGSPPYLTARSYLENGQNIGIARKCEAWISWMLEVTTEALRVSRGAVVWVAAGSTKDRNYQPACEGLMYEWWKRGGHAYRPCYWHRVGIPGSGGDQWFRADIEYAMCFKMEGELPWTDNLANGQPCKCPPGGQVSHRNASGRRASEGKMMKLAGDESAPKVKAMVDGRLPSASLSTSKRTAIGTRVQVYTPPEKANPGNLISIPVGGGRLGHHMAHENEAPYPVDLAAWFIRSLCPPNGLVCDPFCGSGTTLDAARREGRNGIGFDLRMSQVELAKRRMESPPTAPKEVKPDTDQLSLFGSVA